MTAKHVVADDLFGRISRKTWELQRRVLEGTLDPQRTLASLQAFIEGRQAMLPIETHPITISEKVYQLSSLHPHISLCELAAVRGFAEIDSKLERFDPEARTAKAKKSAVVLAQFHKTYAFGAAKIAIEDMGYQLADAWEMMSFAKVAGFMKLANQDCRVHCLGTAGKYWLADSLQKGKGYICFNSYHSHFQEGRGWELWIRGDRDASVEAGHYVLLRAKS